MLRTWQNRNFILHEHLYTNSCLRNLCNASFFAYELSHTNRLHTNFILYTLYFNFIRYELIRALSYTNLLHYETLLLSTFLPYEHYGIRTSAYEHLLMNIFPYKPCVYKLLSGYHSKLPQFTVHLFSEFWNGLIVLKFGVCLWTN